VDARLENHVDKIKFKKKRKKHNFRIIKSPTPHPQKKKIIIIKIKEQKAFSVAPMIPCNTLTGKSIV
jgi:hypothetical protein